MASNGLGVDVTFVCKTLSDWTGTVRHADDVHTLDRIKSECVALLEDCVNRMAEKLLQGDLIDWALLQALGRGRDCFSSLHDRLAFLGGMDPEAHEIARLFGCLVLTTNCQRQAIL
ncbi:MAG: hypothetical protein KDK78_06530 [Chlamydiia bacterium]|nr:hypothetical protein [Chlamydiia bacterium]